MSVLIKGMEMPKACGLCPFDDYGYCTRAKRYSGGSATHGRASFCPLVELSEKHGRLIDADALIAEWKDVLSTDGISPMFAMVVEGCIRDVERAKEIVEAEGE